MTARHLLILILWLAPALAGAQAAPDAPAKPARVPIFYRILKRYAFDLDKVMDREIGVRIGQCSFADAVTKKTITYAGLGPCLYRNLTASFKTEAVPGVIRAEAEVVATGRRVPVEITWSPTNVKKSSAIRRVLRELFGRAPRPGERLETLLGTVSLRFLEPIEPAQMAGPWANLVLDAGLGPVQEIRFSLDGTVEDPEVGEMVTGQVSFFQTQSSDPGFRLDLKTDFRLLKKQPFILEIEGQ